MALNNMTVKMTHSEAKCGINMGGLFLEDYFWGLFTGILLWPVYFTGRYNRTAFPYSKHEKDTISIDIYFYDDKLIKYQIKYTYYHK